MLARSILVSTNQVLYVADGVARAERVSEQLDDELTELTVHATTVADQPREVDGSDLGCVVYESSDAAVNSPAYFERTRSDGPAVPFLLVVAKDADLYADEFLAAERTDVVRFEGGEEAASILANRIEMLVDSYRRDGELSRERDRFETLFEKLTQPTVEIEFDGEEPIISRANRAFEETFGYDEATLRGESIDDYVVPPDCEEEAAELNQRVLDGEVFSVEVTRQTAHGERDFLLQNAVYPDASGEFAMYTDISDRKERERELERQNERLDEFASIVSHDLRNPLNVAQIRAELLSQQISSEHIDYVTDALDRMETMVDDLLTMAHAGAATDDAEPVVLRTVTVQSWESVQASDATLVNEFPSGWTVEGNASLLQHVFENLFNNAIEHNDSPVTVRTGTLDEDSGFFIADDGGGIPQAHRADVFDRGYTTDEEGTGFGLSIVSELLKAHGWQISLTESETGGARFEVLIE